MILYYLLTAAFVKRGVERKLLYANNAVGFVWGLLTAHPMKIERHSDFRDDTSFVLTPNHASTIDMLIISYALRSGVRLLVKEELRNNILLGPLFRRIAIFVDRGDKASRRQAMVELAALTKRNVSLLIFPEGTRNRTNEPLQPFYDGAFKQAIEAQIPIVPMVLLNTHYLMPPTGWTALPGKLTAAYLQPISTKGLGVNDVEVLKSTVRAKMLQRIQAHEAGS